MDRTGARWLQEQLLPFVGPTAVGGLGLLAAKLAYDDFALISEFTKNEAPYRSFTDGDDTPERPGKAPKIDAFVTPDRDDPMDTTADAHNSLSSRHSAMKRARQQGRKKKTGKKTAGKRRRKLNRALKFKSATKKRARKRVNNKQPIGVYKLRKGIKPRISKAAKYGIQYTTENGGFFSDPDCVYVGHSSEAPQTMWRLAMYAVMRKLFTKGGFPFADWNSKEGLDLVTGEQKLKIKLWYSDAPDAVIQNARDFTIFADTNDTYNSMALAWANDTQTNIMTNPNVELKRVELQEFRGDPTIVYERNVAALNFEDMRICFVTKSVLRVQNRTKDDSTASGNLVNSINANPLVGYRYECMGKGFRENTQKNIQEGTGTPAIPPNETDTGEGWGANAINGYIAARGQFTNPLASKKPVNPSHFRSVTKVNKIGMVPGTIKEDKLTHIHKMRLNKFIDMLELYVRNVTTQKGLQYENYGKSAMIGLEKAMQTGEDATIRVKIGWQLDRHYSCYVTEYKNTVAQRIVELNPGFTMS